MKMYVICTLRYSQCSLAAMASSFLMATLIGCAAPLVAGVPNIVLTEVAPRAINGKGLVEDGVDAATGKDCRVIEGVTRKDRKVCETRGSAATDKDFKGLSGMGDDPSPSEIHQ